MANGIFEPIKCFVPPNKRVAVIVPFRDNLQHTRLVHLKMLLYYMVPIFIRQNLRFSFYVVNQHGQLEIPFNRGKLLNVGYVEAIKDGFDCIFFHDVDLLLEDDRNIYECHENPRHYSAWIDGIPNKYILVTKN